MHVWSAWGASEILASPDRRPCIGLLTHVNPWLSETKQREIMSIVHYKAISTKVLVKLPPVRPLKIAAWRPRSNVCFGEETPTPHHLLFDNSSETGQVLKVVEQFDSLSLEHRQRVSGAWGLSPHVSAKKGLLLSHRAKSKSQPPPNTKL